MSNPDVACFEARRRLAKVWTPAPSPMGVVHVPTIGMMLAEIRRRGWDVTLRVLGEWSEVGIWWPGKSEPLGHVIEKTDPANALTLALAEALEKEAGRGERGGDSR